MWIKILDVTAAGDHRHASTATGWEYKGTIFRSDWNIRRVKLSIKVVLGSRSTARCRATPNHTRVCIFPKQLCKRIESSIVSRCFVAVGKMKILYKFVRLFLVCKTTFNKIKFMSATVSRRKTTKCVVVVEIPYGTRRLYAGQDVRALFTRIEASARCLRLSTVFPVDVKMLFVGFRF